MQRVVDAVRAVWLLWISTRLPPPTQSCRSTSYDSQKVDGWTLSGW